MMKAVLAAFIALAISLAGRALVYAQSSSPTPSPAASPSPTPTTPQGAPRTGFGTLAE